MPHHDEQTWIELADGTRRILGPEEILPDGARFVRPFSVRDRRAPAAASVTLHDRRRAQRDGWGRRDTLVCRWSTG